MPHATPAPTSKAPAKPGPRVNARQSICCSVQPACCNTLWVSGSTRRMWSRLASSGTTPPYDSCICTWLCRAWASNRGGAVPASARTKATPVSSHELSIPKISMG